MPSPQAREGGIRELSESLDLREYETYISDLSYVRKYALRKNPFSGLPGYIQSERLIEELRGHHLGL